MERISVRVDDQLKQELEAEAREKGVSPSEIMRQASKEYMPSRRSWNLGFFQDPANPLVHSIWRLTVAALE